MKMTSLSSSDAGPNLKQEHKGDGGLMPTESTLALERFEPGSRRDSMLASLRLLATNGAGTRSRFESRRRGSLFSSRRKSDSWPGDHEPNMPRRRGSLFEESSTTKDGLHFAKRSRKRKNLSVPDILEEGARGESNPRSPLRSRRHTSSHSGRPGLLLSFPREGFDGVKPPLATPETGLSGFLATGNGANTFKNRLQQIRKSRRERLLRKFKSYSRLVIFLHRLCKNHFLSVDDRGNSHRGKYIGDGEEQELLFDVRYFRAHKEAGISAECKKILSLQSHQRTEKDEYRALIALRNFPTFAEFPLAMQQDIVKVGWYEKYQAQRVILRQGHRPLNFYFIMTGSVVVRVLEEGSDNPRTVVYLNRGETFGELGLVNKETRKSTVISRERVELLCIGEEDYTRIFMAGGLQTLLDPTRSDFIRNLTFLEGWPMHLLAENPKKCIFSYFKRGDVLVKNSKKSDWILIVKSGSCSVMKLLHKEKAKEKKKRKKSETGAPDLTTDGKQLSLRGGTLESYQQRKTRDEFEHFMKDLNIHEEETAIHERPSGSEITAHGAKEKHISDGNAGDQSRESNFPDVKKPNEKRSGRPILPSQNSSVHLSRLPSHASILDRTTNAENNLDKTKGSQQNPSHQEPLGQKKTVATEIVDDVLRKEDDGTEPVWVKVQTLTKGSYFGLSDMLFDVQPSFSVVSNGAECILMSKKFYREHVTPKMLTRLRREEQSFPNEQELQKNLEVKLKWDSFKKKSLLSSLQRSRKRNNKQR